MKTWRKVVTVCLKYAMLNVLLVFLMLATTFLQVLPPAMAASPLDSYLGSNNSLGNISQPANTTQNTGAQGNNSLPASDMSGIRSNVNIPPSVTGNVSLGEHVPAPGANLNSIEQTPSNTAPIYARASFNVTPSKDIDMYLNSSTGKVKLHMPQGAVDQGAQVNIIDHGAQSGGMLSVLEFHAYPNNNRKGLQDANTSGEIKQFKKGLTLSIQNTPEDLAGLDTDTLKLYYLDENTSQWIPVPDSKFDPKTNTLTATLTHFSYYGEQAAPTIMGPGNVMSFQTDLNSGASTYSYPIAVPPGVGGLEPSIDLSYNSGSIDEMKNKKDVGSWVGIGWALSIGAISYDETSGQYLLTFGGFGSYQLVNDSQGIYHTVPESFYKITRNGREWDVYDTEGTYYCFGGTVDSQQCHDYSIFYRWDLNYIRDTNGNAINISYVRDQNGASIRAAYPSFINYNNNHVSIAFNSSFDSNDSSGPLRNDDPRNPLPKVIETRRLNSINISVDGSLVRSYGFTYNTTPYYSSTDYGGTDYAGADTLTSVTEYGSDGISQLPAMSFTYTNLYIHQYDPNEPTYSGNPGNPALLYWPYLTTATNGYGATVTYDYYQNPSAWGQVNNLSDRVNLGGISPSLHSLWCSPRGDAFTGNSLGNISHYDGLAWHDTNNSYSESISGIWGTSSTNVFAAGTNAILHYDGAAWSSMLPNMQVGLNSIWGTSSSNVFAVGANGTILVYNGSGWGQMTSNTTQELTAIWGGDSNNIFVVGSNGTILYNNGSAWRQMSSNTTQRLNSVWGNSSTNVFAIGGNGTILRYNGSVWRPMTSNTAQNLTGVWGSSGTNIFAVSDGGTILRCNGSVWTAMAQSFSGYSFYSVCGNSPNNVYVSGYNGANIVLNYNGSTWSEAARPTYAFTSINNAAGSGLVVSAYTGDSCDLFRYDGFYWSKEYSTNSLLWGRCANLFVGTGGTIIRYNGSAWSQVNSNTARDLYGVALSSGFNGGFNLEYAVGDGGTVLKSNNSAQTWFSDNSTTTQNLRDVFDVCVPNSICNYAYAVGEGGTIINSSYLSGFSWSSMNSTTTQNLWGIWGMNQNNLFAVGDGGTILHWNGAAWSRMSGIPSDINFRRVCGTSNTDVFAVGQDSYYGATIYHYDGRNWQAMPVDVSFPLVLGVACNSPAEVYAAGLSESWQATLLKYTSAANIWTRNVVNKLTQDPGNGPQQVYTYTYSGTPQYFKVGPDTHAWADQYRGFPQVRVTDAEGNYVNHYFWTTGSGDAEMLTGKEYRTEWYDSSNQSLERKDFTWAYRFNDSTPSAPCSNLSAYWKFDENGGQTVSDSSGKGNSGTLGPSSSLEPSDPSWTSGGRFGSALSFDGQDDYVHITNSSPLSMSGSFTLEAWVKRDSLDTKDCILALGSSTSNSSNSHQWLLYIDNSSNNNRVAFEMSLAGGLFSMYGDSGSACINDSQWHHIAVTVKVTSTIIVDGCIYLDGVLKVKKSTVGVLLKTGLTDCRIGSRAAGGDYFHGTIDDVRIYTRNLSASEIMQEAKYSSPFVYLTQTTDTIGSKTARTRYEYDAYGNVQYEYRDGDINISDDDVTTWRSYSPNISANILNKPAIEGVYNNGIIYKLSGYFYDGSTDVNTPPAKGQLTTVWNIYGEGYASTSYVYDSYGNVISQTDANGNTWNTTYDSTYHIFPQTIYSPIAGQSESYTFDAKTGNLISRTDVNGQTTSYTYDVFGRETKVIKPGDNSSSPSVQYQYNNWGTLNQQNLKTMTKVNTSDYLWSSQYFDGFGRVIQTQSGGEDGRTIIGSTTAYSGRGLVANVYVAQDMDSSQVSGYQSPGWDWKSSSYVYDGLGRATSATAADGTTTGADYSIPWQQTVTNPLGYKHTYYYDAFGRLVRVDELDASNALYATTNYSYDGVGNLIQVVDGNGSITSMSYDLLGRKTSMSDPDMGNWNYRYDNNSNLISQTDAKNQTVTLTYDALNRLTGKLYPVGSGMTNVSYTYDSTAGVNYGVGRRTGMSDASGATSYKYDARGRLIQESRNILGANYVTGFSYDAGDRLTTVTYPTGETVTQTYDGRGLPNTLNGSTAGNLVTNTSYNQLGQTTRINLGSGDFETYAYYGLDAGAPSGYWGRLWQITTSNASATLSGVQYTWDANGNMLQRQDAITGETENFGYDFLDRLTSVSGAYNQSYTYDKVGNILSMNNVSYTYGAKPHAVTAVGANNYSYDANGNMITRGGQTITWDLANMPVSVTTGGNTSTFVYDGDGNRVKKIEGGQTTLYVNQYYEKNLNTSAVTTYYYLGNQEVAYRSNNSIRYVQQDSLSSTSVTTNSAGAIVAAIKYFPFGGTRSQSGNLDTDKLFTGQRLDQTGLYFYNARYYDATIGRFISPDSIVQDLTNPQTLNRYSYCLNNPLKYIDPSGHYTSSPDVGDPTTPAGKAAMAASIAAAEAAMEAANACGGGADMVDKVFSALYSLYSGEAGTGGGSTGWNTGAFKAVVPILGVTAASGADYTPIGWIVSASAVLGAFDTFVYQNRDKIYETLLSAWNWLFGSDSAGDDGTTVDEAGRSKGEKINDATAHPENWEPAGPPEAEPATSPDYPGGTSVEQPWRNTQTGETLTRHTIYGPNGQVWHAHWR